MDNAPSALAWPQLPGFGAVALGKNPRWAFNDATPAPAKAAYPAAAARKCFESTGVRIRRSLESTDEEDVRFAVAALKALAEAEVAWDVSAVQGLLQQLARILLLSATEAQQAAKSTHRPFPDVGADTEGWVLEVPSRVVVEGSVPENAFENALMVISVLRSFVEHPGIAAAITRDAKTMVYLLKVVQYGNAKLRLEMMEMLALLATHPSDPKTIAKSVEVVVWLMVQMPPSAVLASSLSALAAFTPSEESREALEKAVPKALPYIDSMILLHASPTVRSRTLELLLAISVMPSLPLKNATASQSNVVKVLIALALQPSAWSLRSKAIAILTSLSFDAPSNTYCYPVISALSEHEERWVSAAMEGRVANDTANHLAKLMKYIAKYRRALARQVALDNSKAASSAAAPPY